MGFSPTVPVDDGPEEPTCPVHWPGMSGPVMYGPDALEMRCPLLSRKQTSIGHRRKVGFLDLIPKSLRANEAGPQPNSARDLTTPTLCFAALRPTIRSQRLPVQCLL